MKFRAILTHNPQDYFEDKEDLELVDDFVIQNRWDYLGMGRVLDGVMGGYKAIILLKEGDDTG